MDVAVLLKRGLDEVLVNSKCISERRRLRETAQGSCTDAQTVSTTQYTTYYFSCNNDFDKQAISG